jgi:tRNA pseudouridine55 synthase
VGHAGTLDPSATGVLLVGLGRVTRLLRFLTELPKRYEGEVVLGVETDTLDADGTVVATHAMDGVTLADVQRAAATLVGEIDQVPPMVSAVKVDGRRLHQLARQGIDVERAPRRVRVHRFDVSPTREPLVFGVEVECSSGTYVRVLAADVGRVLGGGAHLRALRRTAIGGFDVAQACALDDVALDRVLPAAAAVAHLPAVRVDDALAAQVATGRVLPRDVLDIGDDAGPWAVLATGGALLAVYEPRDDTLAKPAVVVADPL